jgi:hypothetical protein
MGEVGMKPLEKQISGIENGVVLRGRMFSEEELGRIKELVLTHPNDHRQALSKMVCEALGWFGENGRPKDRSCRDVLIKLDLAGFIRLPPPRKPPRPRRPSLPLLPRTAPRPQIVFDPKVVTADDFRLAGEMKGGHGLWNEFVERYHYLKFGIVVGPQVKYFVELHGEPIACLSFGGAAWKVEARDRWIGWSSDQRKEHLRYVVNNVRFLVLPWVRVKNLASRILSLATRRLVDDWQRLYGYRPYLLETFVHADRHAGTCYKAANWILVGETKGRGRMDRRKEAKLPRKMMFVLPLVKDARERLTHGSTRKADETIGTMFATK